MKWTKEVPKVDGLYWMISIGDDLGPYVMQREEGLWYSTTDWSIGDYPDNWLEGDAYLFWSEPANVPPRPEEMR